MTINGLTIGGKVRRDLAGIALNIPLLSYHKPGRLCWSWGLDWFRYRPGTGWGHSAFRIVRIPGAQPRTIIDVLWLGSLQLITQPRQRCDL